MKSQSKEIQQSFYLRLGDRDWDSYEENEYLFLKRNIGFALFGNPPNLETNDDGGYNEDQRKKINTIFDVLISNGCCNEKAGTLIISIVFVVCEKDELIFVVPIFKIRKCQDSKNFNCRPVVDNLGRIYKSFQNFLLENLLPPCRMIVPRDGIYKGRILPSARNREPGVEENDPELEVVEVELDEFMSPASGSAAVAVDVTDKVSTGAAIGSSVIIGASLIPAITVAPVLLAGAAVASAAVGAWGLFRGSTTLYDRAVHGQSIGVTNSEALGCYFNIAGGITFAATAGASQLISAAARSGTAVSQTTRLTYNAVMVSSLILNGAGIVNSGYNIFIGLQRGETPTPLEIFQFTSQILFFSHAAVNLRSANSIINETQASVIREYEQSLRSNRHRKMFRKATLESRRVHGQEAGNQETIRGLKHIQNKDDFFAGLVRTNKDFNKNNARFTITSDGKVAINSAHIVDPMEFWSIGTSGRQHVFGNVAAPQPSMTQAQFSVNHTRISTRITCLITQFAPALGSAIFSNDNRELITILISEFTETVQNLILGVIVNFLSIIESFVSDLERIFPFKAPVVIFLQFLLTYCQRSMRTNNDVPEQVENDISSHIERILRGLLTDEIRFDDLIRSFRNWIQNKLQSLLLQENRENSSTSNRRTIRVVCPICLGYFYKSDE